MYQEFIDKTLKGDKNISDNLPITDLTLHNENFLAILKYGLHPSSLNFKR